MRCHGRRLSVLRHSDDIVRAGKCTSYLLGQPEGDTMSSISCTTRESKFRLPQCRLRLSLQFEKECTARTCAVVDAMCGVVRALFSKHRPRDHDWCGQRFCAPPWIHPGTRRPCTRYLLQCPPGASLDISGAMLLMLFVVMHCRCSGNTCWTGALVLRLHEA